MYFLHIYMPKKNPSRSWNLDIVDCGTNRCWPCIHICTHSALRHLTWTTPDARQERTKRLVLPKRWPSMCIHTARRIPSPRSSNTSQDNRLSMRWSGTFQRKAEKKRQDDSARIRKDTEVLEGLLLRALKTLSQTMHSIMSKNFMKLVAELIRQ